MAWPEELHRQYLQALDEREKEVERADALDDAIRDALDIATGWSAKMTDSKRLNVIASGLNEALRLHGVQNRKQEGE